MFESTSGKSECLAQTDPLERSPEPGLRRCKQCKKDVAYISLDEVALLLKCNKTRVLRFLMLCSIHSRMNPGGDLEVCLPSLLRKQKLARRIHEISSGEYESKSYEDEMG